MRCLCRSQQVAPLLAAGCVKVYQEKASAASAERSKLKREIAALNAGDVLMDDHRSRSPQHS